MTDPWAWLAKAEGQGRSHVLDEIGLSDGPRAAKATSDADGPWAPLTAEGGARLADAAGTSTTSRRQAPLPPAPPAPAQLLRDQTGWNKESVKALLDGGAVQREWLPDLRAVAPTHLQIQNEHQREMLRFSNSIANTGAGHLQVRRGRPLDPVRDQDLIAEAVELGLDPSQAAVTGQELLDANGNIAAVIANAALSEYHPEHLHFHIGETAGFSLEALNPATGAWDPITGRGAVKTTFCLIDINRIEPVAGDDPDLYEVVKSPAHANHYNDCSADVQGITSGWIDRYSHSLKGQELDVTGLPAGVYRLVTQVNPSQWFLESDFTNNRAWTGFVLSRDSQGNPLIDDSDVGTGGLWFAKSPNGMG